MERLVALAVRLIRAARKAYAKKWSFCGVFAIIFVASVFVLGKLDLLPNAPASSAVPAVAGGFTDTTTLAPSVPELPVAITIPAIGLSADVSNPTTTDTAALDRALLHGAVRYPTSAKLGETGNVILFGHSSYLPIVLNQHYKTFNGIQKLAPGDAVVVSSSGTAYEYLVKSVAKESASDAIIPLSVAGNVLTLSTCDSFSVKTDRFVVTADFVGRHALST